MSIKKMAYRTILLSALVCAAGCEDIVESFDDSVRSGTVAHDDVEAPLTEKAEKYKHALELSNDFLELWFKKDFETIHSTMVDPEVQEQLSVAKMNDIYANVESTYGPMKSYKTGQWAFEPKKAKKQYFLFSIKIVTHEKDKLNYMFEFVLDGEYKKIAGFYVRPKPNQRAPGQIHNNKQ